MNQEPILSGSVYHIYNRGNNRNDLFFENQDYELFLRKFNQYILPVAETYAWCLMKNHFHFLVYVREKSEINEQELYYSTVEKTKKLDLSSQFAHFFNSYTQSINKKYGMTGSLFERPFKRKKVETQDYLNTLIFYIHNNPVHHGFEKRMIDYPWSSYDGIINAKPIFINRENILNNFDGLENFVLFHNQDTEIFNSLDLKHAI